MRIRSCLAIALVCCLPGITAVAQNQPASTVRTLLAAGRLGSVVDTPLNFTLLSVRLPATQRVSYSGPNAMIYALSGGLGFDLDGAAQPVVEGAGAFIPVGRAVTFSASGPGPANFLLFVLSPAADAQKQLLGSPATVEELYHSPEALPGLQAGPYEFSLTRVSLPPGMPANPPHYRSGAVLYYVAGVHRRRQNRAQGCRNAAFRACGLGPPMVKSGRRPARADPGEHQPGGHPGSHRGWCEIAHRCYSITTSARSSTAGGITKPSACAVLKLTANSNLVGCSTGMSPGGVPLKILRTISAVRRWISRKSGP